MKQFPRVLGVVVAGIGLAATVVSCSAEGPRGSGGDSLVVETNFSLQSIDPARQFEFTGITIDKAIYETTLKFVDGDLDNPGDGLCSYEISEDSLVTTLHCENMDSNFSNGDPVTVDDIVFSYERLQGVKGNPSFYLDGVTVEKTDENTVTLTSDAPNPALPFILPNANLGILNAAEVRANGGATDETDDAEQFLNNNSQGSGAYYVESYNAESSVVLAYNEHYSGPEPKYKRVVINNVSANTQLTDIQSGQAHVVLDLSPDQVSDLPANAAQVKSLPSTKSIYIYASNKPDVGGITANVHFRDAVRHAIDYEKVLELAGEGSQRLASVIPNEFSGAVPSSEAPARNLDKAKELLSESGYNGEGVSFHYATEKSVNGVNIALLAESLQAQLREAGINIDLSPAPSSTNLDGQRAGKHAMGIGNWGADFPDPTNYLEFAPGGSSVETLGWTMEESPDVVSLFDLAAAASSDERGTAYAKAFAAATQAGPFIPLVQPVQTVVFSNGITKYVSNADVAFDFSLAE